MVGEDLQFDRHVDLAHIDSVWHLEHCGREVEDASDARGDEPVAHTLGGPRRRGDHTDGDAVPLDEAFEPVGRLYGEARDLLADLGRVGVDKRRDAEPARSEPSVVGQRMTKMTDTDERHGPVLGQPDLARYLVAEEVDAIADAPGSVRAEVGQVLAEFRRRDPRSFGELVG